MIHKAIAFGLLPFLCIFSLQLQFQFTTEQNSCTSRGKNWANTCVCPALGKRASWQSSFLELRLLCSVLASCFTVPSLLRMSLNSPKAVLRSHVWGSPEATSWFLYGTSASTEFLGGFNSVVYSCCASAPPLPPRPKLCSEGERGLEQSSPPARLCSHWRTHCPFAHKGQQCCGAWWSHDVSYDIGTTANAGDATGYERAPQTARGEGRHCEEVTCHTHGHLAFCSSLLDLGGPGDRCRKELWGC